jgi:hypothetical protein
MRLPLHLFPTVTALLFASCVAQASPLERQLDFVVTAEGEQSWRNALQWSKSRTKQRYEISTTLRSDGRRYADNLLDTDPDRRMEIKREYLTRRGLERLKRENGGKLPKPGQLQAFADSAQTQIMDCRGESECNLLLAERFAALAALEQNTTEELEEFLRMPANDPAARYLYFFGYHGCPNRIQISSHSHFEGEQAFDKEKKKLVPFVMDRNANASGSEAEQKALCWRYTATVDTKSGAIFLENAFIPSPRGVTLYTAGKNTTRKDEDLPIPVQVLDWTSGVLRQAKEAGAETQVFRFTRPLDGNASVLGDFDGSLKATMTWSFKNATQ